MNENYSRKIYDVSTGEYEDLQTGYNCITGNRAIELLKMAMEDKIPDGNYSDYEIAVWSKMKAMIA